MHSTPKPDPPAVDLLIHARLLDQPGNMAEGLFGARKGLFDRLLLVVGQEAGFLAPERFGGFEAVVDLVDCGEEASALFADGDDFEDLFGDLD